MKKKVVEVEKHKRPSVPMGLSPAALANRKPYKPRPWCKEPDVEFDPNSDPDFPREILYKDVVKATLAIKGDIPKSPMRRSRQCEDFKMELYYKLEIFQPTGSYEVRSALYCIKRLSEKQKENGVITASSGDWALALAYYGGRQSVPVTIVVPLHCNLITIERCKNYGATIIIKGLSLAESKRHAMILAPTHGLTYLNGFDHPHVIAANGMIGLEILNQLPNVDVILVPISATSLLAGIAAAIKHKHPEILIYGVEAAKSCSFFKAMENERPFTAGSESDVVPVGYNSFQTARSLVDKTVLVDNDWISRAVLHLVKVEKMVVDSRAAFGLAALIPLPSVLPELKNKTVVCVLSGGNIAPVEMIRIVQRAEIVEGITVIFKITIPADDMIMLEKVFSVIAAVGANAQHYVMEPTWKIHDDINNINVQMSCETAGLEHSCRLRRVMERVFPGKCKFLETAFAPVWTCACFCGQ